MTTTDRQISYAAELARLDIERIQADGEAVDYALGFFNRPVALSYQPDNGTAYALVFVPVSSIHQLSEWRVPAGTQRSKPSERWCLVVKANGTSSDFVYPFDLGPGHVHHWGYMSAHCGRECGPADAIALTALFRAICGVSLLQEGEHAST